MLRTTFSVFLKLTAFFTSSTFLDQFEERNAQPSKSHLTLNFKHPAPSRRQNERCYLSFSSLSSSSSASASSCNSLQTRDSLAIKVTSFSDVLSPHFLPFLRFHKRGEIVRSKEGKNENEKLSGKRHLLSSLHLNSYKYQSVS